jgi:hypothetical protein
VVGLLLGVLALLALTDGQNNVWKWTLWIAFGCVYGALITLLCFKVRRFENRQQERDIERYRRDLHGYGSAQTRP